MSYPPTDFEKKYGHIAGPYSVRSRCKKSKDSRHKIKFHGRSPEGEHMFVCLKCRGWLYIHLWE